VAVTSDSVSTTERERAVSTTVSYVLALGITTLLATGLIFAGGQFVSDQRERAVRTEMQIVGEQLASDIEQLDRIVSANPTRIDTGEIRHRMPETIAGESYVVVLRDGPNVSLLLRTENPDVSVTNPIRNRTAISPSVTTGGTVVVRYDAGENEIEVDDA
jgi:hypothetical protein